MAKIKRPCNCGHNLGWHFIGKDCRQTRCGCKKYEERPIIVCLCGSIRFYEQFMKANFEETMAGNIVLSVGFFMHSADKMDWMKREHGEIVGITKEDKIKLDELHKRRIDLADEVLILNVGNYIGESTGSEIDYAIVHGKSIRYLEVHHNDIT